MQQPGYPLSGITVIDFGQIYQGPYATFMMAMAGANVIKIEPPHGEPMRRRARVQGGSVPLAMLNSNKRCITLNLKSQRGRELLVELVKKGDVLLENFAPTVTERLGVGPKVLMEVNPRLIYASGSGYGRSGPYRDNLAMDLTVQAVSGIMSVTGFPDGPPVKAGPAICDFLGGTHLYAAVMTALYERERTGKGRLVEVAMLDTTYPTMVSNLGLYFGQGDAIPSRTGNRHGGLSVAPYNVYQAKDGYVAIIVVTEEHWPNLLTAMGRDDLKGDPRFASNPDRVKNLALVDDLVGGWVAGLTKQEAYEIAQRHRVPTAPVRELPEVVEDEHLHQRGMLSWMDHPEVGRIAAPNSPLRFDGTPPMPLQPSGDLGQHNVEVYGELLGLSEAEVAELAEVEAI
jgi:crotonobetainyl-CoA:carnitine CoA-transferase CaiB-like acyl-CoA transferase